MAIHNNNHVYGKNAREVTYGTELPEAINLPIFIWDLVGINCYATKEYEETKCNSSHKPFKEIPITK